MGHRYRDGSAMADGMTGSNGRLRPGLLRMRALVAVAWALLLTGCWPDMAAVSAQQNLSIEREQAARVFADPKARELATAAAIGDAETIRRLMQDEVVDPDVIFGGSNGGMPLLAWPIARGSPEGL